MKKIIQLDQVLDLDEALQELDVIQVVSFSKNFTLSNSTPTYNLVLLVDTKEEE